MGKILQFKSCATGGEYTGLGAATPSSYGWTAMATSQVNTQARIDATYADDPNLNGKVIGIGYGWQKYVLPSSGKVKFTIRGAAGGCVSKSGFSINPVTGATSGTGNLPGRGAKLCGEIKLRRGDILYILVGMRGWCNSWVDWGGGGGGASVILKDNPSGAYTFAPLNRKVDVVAVAGGGGGTWDDGISTAHYGKDAVTTNGTNTNGGSSSRAQGGAGLTGNGASGSGGNPSYSLLSGNPAITVINQAHQGGWGGGGASYNGGGGGGGYSGGSTDDSIGGYGGTSYINSSLCIEISRGYATVAEDGHRNLTNPWTAYGFVELELGRAENKFILAQDSDGYKYFDGDEDIHGTVISGTTNEWQLLPDQTNINDAIYSMYGARVITNADGLKTPVRFLVSSPDPDEVISINGNVAGTVVKLVNDVSMADVSTLLSLTATTNLTNTLTKFAVSKDQGVTWQTYDSGIWSNIDISDIDTFRSIGYDMAFFTAIPLADWQAYNAKTIRFAFCITQYASTGNTSLLSMIQYVANLVGSWAHFTESQASYQYITDDTVEITFKEAGNYKVNYLDSIS